MIYDKFPKGRVHLLVLAKTLEGPAALTVDHIPLLEQLSAVADWIAAGLSQRYRQ